MQEPELITISLDGECAIVTGAGNGMGRVVTFTFVAAGADLGISDSLADVCARSQNKY